MTSDLHSQIRNVLAGRTAFGKNGYGPMGFPRDPIAYTALLHWTDRFLADSLCVDDRTRTLFIRKLGTYLTRYGYQDHNETQFIDGTLWFVDHPTDLLSKMSFNAAARRRQQQVATLAADQRRIDRVLVTSAMAVPEPPCPVLLSEGDYALLQFVHPAHLLRAGLDAGNCLAQTSGGEDLPNARYWMRIAKKEIRLFAIRKGTRLCALFSIAEDAMRECEYIRPPSDLLPFVTKAHAALEALLGPLRDELTCVIVDGGMINSPRIERNLEEAARAAG